MAEKFNENWSTCDIDNGKCFGFGLLCRLNKDKRVTFDYEYSNPKVKYPLRNKKCCHYRIRDKLTSLLKSEWEKING